MIHFVVYRDKNAEELEAYYKQKFAESSERLVVKAWFLCFHVAHIQEFCYTVQWSLLKYQGCLAKERLISILK